MANLLVKQQEKAAKAFAAKWAGKGDEKQDTQRFWMELLQSVYGIDNPADFIEFEKKVQLSHTSYIDVYIRATSTVIEQKSIRKSLDEMILQSDGAKLTPIEQAKRYAASLPYSERPRWVISCNFKEFKVIDMERPNDTPQVIELKNLGKEYYRLNFMVDVRDSNLDREMEISKDAGELVGRLYRSLLDRYKESSQLTEDEILQNLNKLCVRLVFCMYAEDAGLFGRKNLFHEYISQSTPQRLGRDLRDLFRILDIKEDERDPYEEATLAAFPYVNGNLFGEPIFIPNFSQEAFDLLLIDACNFDWAQISPTIFGAIFESTLNPEIRRHGGMHYTSIENIHKVIDPLFLNTYRQKFQEIMTMKKNASRIKHLKELQKELSTLKFLDPASGSGNFLTESYLSLRRLENDILRETVLDVTGSGVFGFVEEGYNPIQVTIQQFYGIEINDFAVAVAKTAIWIAEAQMFKETESILHREMDFLPLHTNANIHEGNALHIDWADVVPSHELTYIMGNPPFIGASMMNVQQKKDAVDIFGKIKLSNSIDYVGAWYHKAAAYIQNTSITCAFVSTNSITQGEQVAPLWEKLIKTYSIRINFAHRTFRWDNEASLKAAVHCVIIGFSQANTVKERIIYPELIRADNINPYLLNAPNVLITSRSKPLCFVPPMTKGNQPSDGGNLILTPEERTEILSKEPLLEKWIKPYVGAVEYLNNKTRYCFWLKDAGPSDLRKSKILSARVEAVKIMRENSTAKPTRQKALTPHLFFSAPQTESTYLMIPRVSSENRRYIPIGFMQPNIIASDSCSIIPNASLYHFGILTSNVHMAWMRTVAGRLKSDYRYSGSVVYNTFPWPSPTVQQKTLIEKTAQAILNARKIFSDSTLADMYATAFMPIELRNAHRANDRAVMAAYGFNTKMTEEECVAELMKLYEELVRTNK